MTSYGLADGIFVFIYSYIYSNVTANHLTYVWENIYCRKAVTTEKGAKSYPRATLYYYMMPDFRLYKHELHK